jgi:hypothetical protein
LPGFDDWYKRWKAAADKSPRTKKKCAEPAGAHDKERSCEEEKLIRGAEHTEWLNIFANGNRDIKPGLLRCGFKDTVNDSAVWSVQSCLEVPVVAAREHCIAVIFAGLAVVAEHKSGAFILNRPPVANTQ